MPSLFPHVYNPCPVANAQQQPQPFRKQPSPSWQLTGGSLARLASWCSAYGSSITINGRPICRVRAEYTMEIDAPDRSPDQRGTQGLWSPFILPDERWCMKEKLSWLFYWVPIGDGLHSPVWTIANSLHGCLYNIYRLYTMQYVCACTCVCLCVYVHQWHQQAPFVVKEALKRTTDFNPPSPRIPVM